MHTVVIIARFYTAISFMIEAHMNVHDMYSAVYACLISCLVVHIVMYMYSSGIKQLLDLSGRNSGPATLLYVGPATLDRLGIVYSICHCTPAP